MQDCRVDVCTHVSVPAPDPGRSIRSIIVSFLERGVRHRMTPAVPVPSDPAVPVPSDPAVPVPSDLSVTGGPGGLRRP